jgi:hypothetical protein
MFNHVDFGNPLVILPPKYLEEVRSAPQTKLSFPLSLEKVCFRMSILSQGIPSNPKQSTIINDIGGPKMTDEAILVVRHDVTRALSWFPLLLNVDITTNDHVAELIPDMHQKCLDAYKVLMPPCKGTAAFLLADVGVADDPFRRVDASPHVSILA